MRQFMIKYSVSYSGLNHLSEFRTITNQYLASRRSNPFAYKLKIHAENEMTKKTFIVWLTQLSNNGINLAKISFKPPLKEELENIRESLIKKQNKLTILIPKSKSVLTYSELLSINALLVSNSNSKPYNVEISPIENEEHIIKWLNALSAHGIDIKQLTIEKKSLENEELDEFSDKIEQQINKILLTEETHKDMQSWFLTRMRAMGYKEIGGGHCWGIAHMAKQAFTAGELDVFSTRLKKISKMPIREFEEDFKILRIKVDELRKKATNLRSKANKITIDTDKSKFIQKAICLEQKANKLIQTIVDINAFFDGVALTQAPWKYSEIIPQLNKEERQNVQLTLPITSPLSLDKSHQITSVGSFIGSYTEQQLATYFSLLEKYAGDIPFALIHTNSNHGINLNYDPKNKQWILIDANKFTEGDASPLKVGESEDPIKIFELDQLSLLAKEIKTSLFQEQEMSSDMTTSHALSKELEARVQKIIQDTEWKTLHPNHLSDSTYKLTSKEIWHGNRRFLKFLSNSDQIGTLVSRHQIPPDQAIVLIAENNVLSTYDKKKLLIQLGQNITGQMLLDAETNNISVKTLVDNIPSPSAQMLLDVADNSTVLYALLNKITAPSNKMLEDVKHNKAIYQALVNKTPTINVQQLQHKSASPLDKSPPNLQKSKLSEEEQKIISALDMSIKNMSKWFFITGYKEKKAILENMKINIMSNFIAQSDQKHLNKLLNDFANEANKARLQTNKNTNSFNTFKDELAKLKSEENTPHSAPDFLNYFVKKN